MGLADYSLDRELRSLPHETTYEAAHLVLPRRACIKVAADRAAGVRFMREACVLEALRHPGVPRVFDCGVSDGRPWLASELIEGTELAMPLEARELVDVLRDVGAILAHAHSRGVIHGGLWLDAVVRDDGSRGFPYALLQWSEARFGDPIDGAADIYGLGLAIYAAMPSNAPAAVTALVDDMLAADPADRPSAVEVNTRASTLSELFTPEEVAEEVALIVDLSRELVISPSSVIAVPLP